MSRRKKRALQTVDITPLIDVLFMLIIFLVLTTTFAQGRVEVALPQGGGKGEEKASTVLLTVTREDSLLWNGESLRSVDLPARLSAVKEKGSEVRVAGDADAPYGAVAEVLDTLRVNGIQNVSLLFEGGTP